MSFNEIKRSKSLCSLETDSAKMIQAFCDYGDSRTASESSEYAAEEDRARDEFNALELKVDRLSDMFKEQCRLLSEVKEEMRNSKSLMEKPDHVQNKLITELLKKILMKSSTKDLDLSDSEADGEKWSSRAKTLLDALGSKRAFCLDREIRDVFVEFLQSDELKEHIVSATVECVRALAGAGGRWPRELSALHLSLLDRAHRRSARQLAAALRAAFADLERNTASLSKSMYKTTRGLRRALEHHQRILEEASGTRCAGLEAAAEQVLGKELKQWRQRALEALLAPPEEPEEPQGTEAQAYSPLSPPQPADPERSIIDQLMKSAEINKQIRDGDVSGSFEKALSAADLSLVMAACRAADPARVFSPCCLAQPLLLSLAQQLATDMVHDTQLKCRYLEEAIINLDTSDPTTQSHLPVVVRDIRKHLNNFISKYPSHLASRRVMLIIMAADNLLK